MHIYMKKCTHTHTCIYVCVSYTYIYICINILNLVAQHVKEKNKKEHLIQDSVLTLIISFSNYREKKYTVTRHGALKRQFWRRAYAATLFPVVDQRAITPLICDPRVFSGSPGPASYLCTPILTGTRT